MKSKWIACTVAQALVTAAVLISACGCATNQSPVHSASKAGTGRRVKTFDVICHQMSFGGGFGQTLRQVIGTITIDLENNQILWKHTTLKLAPLKLAAPNVFFVEEQNAESGLTFAALVSIKGRSTDGKHAVAIFRDASRVIVDNSGRLSKQGLIHACQTPNGSFDEFYSYFNHLTFPDNYHGLIASTKY